MSDLPEKEATPDQPQNQSSLASAVEPAKGTASTSVSQSPAAVDKASSKKWWTAAGDAFKAFVPERVKDLGDKYGPALFVGFCVGLIIGIGLGVGALIKSDTLRMLLVSAAPNATPTSSSDNVEREEVTDITFSLTDTRPNFLKDYESLLNSFGEANKPGGMIDNPPMGTVVREFAKATQEFKFRLTPHSKSWQIYARLFRQTKLDDRDIYEPLIPLESSTMMIRFKVGECRTGDKLYMVVLAVPPLQHDKASQLTGYFDTQLEK